MPRLRSLNKLIYLMIPVLCTLSTIDSMAGESSNLALVRDGQAQSVIVVPEKPLLVVAYAAQELQYHIREATGATLEIVPEPQAATHIAAKTPIILGDCRATREAGIEVQKMPPSGFFVGVRGNRLLLAGRDSDGPVLEFWHWNTTQSGTLWAVYDFLEKQMGVRWLWPGKLGEFIPKRPSLYIPSGAWTGKPHFAYTRLSASKSQWGKNATVGWRSLETRNRFHRDQEIWLLRQRFAATEALSYGHAFGDYWKRFGKDHPEYFAQLPNGKREPLEGDAEGSNITLCVSQPALHKQIVDDWWALQQTERTRRRTSPADPPLRLFLSACENDSPGLCTCPQCRAWDAPDPRFATSDYWTGKKIPNLRERFGMLGETGWSFPREPSLGDRYAHFYLALQKEAQKHDPRAIVYGYAYANYNEAPQQTKLNENIIISFVPGHLFPWSQTKIDDFRKQWSGWKATGARLFLRPNYNHAGHDMPIFYGHKLAADFSFAAQNGMIGTSFDSLTGQWATQGPTLYVQSRIHTHPDWSAEKILDEYYAAFGPARDAVKRYFDHWREVSDNVTDEQYRRYVAEEEGGTWKNQILIADRIFTPEAMQRGRRLLSAAVEAAADDALAAQRVDYLNKGLTNAELTLAALAASKKAKKEPTPANETTLQTAVRALETFRHEIETENIADMGYLAERESRLWNSSSAR